MINSLIFIFLIISCYLFYIRNVDLLSPKVIFSTLWMTVLWIGSFYLSGLQKVYSYTFLLVMILNITLFVIGTKLICKTGKEETFYLSKKQKIDILKKKYSPKKIKVLMFILTLLGAGLFVLSYIILGPPPLFPGNNIPRVDYYLPVIDVFLTTSIITIALIFIYYVVYKDSKLYLGIILLLNVFFIFSRTNKYLIFFLISVILFLYHFLVKKVNLKKIILALVLSLIGFILMYVFIYNDDIISLETRLQVNQMKIHPLFAFITDPYLYIVMNLENLQNYLQYPISLTYGTEVFYPVLSLLQIDELIKDNFNLVSSYYASLQYPWLNTGTYLAPFFSDFGWIGIIVAPLSLGVISQIYYLKLNKLNINIRDILLYSFIVYTLLMTFFTFSPSTVPFIFNIILIFLVEPVIQNKLGDNMENECLYDNVTKESELDLSIIIVTWNNADLITNCIESIIENTEGITYEIIIIDNDSKDGTLEVIEQKNYSNVITKSSGGNLGFSKANNIGLEMAKGKNILYLNPDTIILDNAITETLKYFVKNQEIGLISCKLLNYDQTTQESTFCFPSLLTIIIEQFNLQNIFRNTIGRIFLYNINKSCEVEWLIGAFMIIKTEDARKISGFTEAYFMYAEDMDICYKVRKQLQKKIYYLNEQKIIHIGGASEDKDKQITRSSKIIDSIYCFMDINYTPIRKQFLLSAYICCYTIKKMIFKVKKDYYRMDRYDSNIKQLYQLLTKKKV